MRVLMRASILSRCSAMVLILGVSTVMVVSKVTSSIAAIFERLRIMLVFWDKHLLGLLMAVLSGTWRLPR